MKTLNPNPSKSEIKSVRASCFKIPTEEPVSDGTLKWRYTDLIVAEVEAGGEGGIGYTYADSSSALLINDTLARNIIGKAVFSISDCWQTMTSSLRNQGLTGLAAMAVSAVDIALWDLKSKLLGIPLRVLLGQVRSAIPCYGSGVFTSYTEGELERHISEWMDLGLDRVKMKVGRNPEKDAERVAGARRAVGPKTGLFLDANGAYTPRQALRMAESFNESGVSWFEEPVPAADRDGTSWIRDRLPLGMELAGGEYGYGLRDFLDLLSPRRLDILQVDVTRCLGITGFLKAASLCEAFHTPMSSHCAPSLHLALGCAVPAMRHVEFFRDHVRIERMLFDGFREPLRGCLSPDLTRPGLGLEFKRADAEKFIVS